MVLVDTSAVSALLSVRSRKRPLQNAVLRAIAGRKTAVSPVIEAELRIWMETLGDNRRSAVRRFCESSSFLPIAKNTVNVYASTFWKKIPGFPVNDRWIACTALEHGLQLVTLDSDFLLIDALKPLLVYLDINKI